MTSTQWVAYHVGTKRKSYNTLPTSDITAEAVTVDGFTLSQTDNAGVTTTAGRSYTASGMIQTRTDGHGNTTTTVTDKAGRTLSYNSYGEQESDSLVADSVTHLITEARDDKGRSTGYIYAKNGTMQQTVTTGYGSDGRIATAGFLHGGSAKQFSYEYMAGTHLLEKLTMPNNMTLTQSYEIQRDLHTGIAYHRGTTLVANRQYSYDILGRPTARNTSRQGTVKNDSFGYNNRSELTTATVNGNNYAYDYDNIGNRAAAVEDSSGVASRTEYTANELNQYTAIGDFTPTFDADGNQTLVKTTTGIWSITYDAENRPVNFTNAESSTVIECAYDHMGRRATKKVTVDGTITLNQRYLYRGYLQIACCDLTRSNHPALWFITWDPTQPIATRPLAIQKDGTWFTYGWDLTKNICEIYGTNGYIRTAYTYSPYGSVTESGNSWQPIQWSSEYNDVELGLAYYNYRHYNPVDGKWIGRDFVLISEYNLYTFCQNNILSLTDNHGLYSYSNRASTTRTETYDKNGYYETANGKANTKFPDGGNIYYEKNGMKCVKTIDVAYVGEITLFKSWDLSKDYRNAYYFDREYKTVLEHEYHHVDITIKYWNIFVNTSKIYEGCYCSKKCASIAGGLIALYKTLYQAISNIENVYFDMKEYGNKLPDENKMKKDFINNISKYINVINDNEKRINKSLSDLDNCV